MKRLAVITLALASTLANAESIKILDVKLPTISVSSSTSSHARFFMNKQSGEGFAQIYSSNVPASGDDNSHTIFSATVKIENLMLMGDQVVYHGVEGTVDCGKMGVSRIFKKPTLQLNGNCSLQTKTVGDNLKVYFITK